MPLPRPNRDFYLGRKSSDSVNRNSRPACLLTLHTRNRTRWLTVCTDCGFGVLGLQDFVFSRVEPQGLGFRGSRAGGFRVSDLSIKGFKGFDVGPSVFGILHTLSS